jgi:signal transduction histidine kinase
MKNTYLAHSNANILPPIKVTIGVGDEQVMFRISDQGFTFYLLLLGGGIPKEAKPNLWNFIKPDSKDILNQPEIVAKVQELVPINVSLGIGLPMSKVYANYWGGNISLYSMERFGVDAYLTITTGNSLENFEYKEE